MGKIDHLKELVAMFGTPCRNTATIVSSARSDVGLKRENNEDAFIANPELSLFLVADGIGGATAGELASRIFADTALEVFSVAGDRSEEATLERVQRAFVLGNQRILDHVKDNVHHKGMACTAELVAFSHTGFVLGHMGDSRTYRLRNKRLIQLTQDHSLVQEQISKGLITPSEAKNHPQRHVIVRAVGVNESLALDIIRGRIQAEDLFLLCSDGLTDMIDNGLIQEVLSSEITISQKVNKLIDLAISAGGNDNITVLLLEII